MAIEIKHLNHIYGQGTIFEQYALNDVNLTIHDGEFIGLIGHTGSGKSTLTQHLNGLLKATSGDILYNGESIYKEGYSMKELRSHVGLVFQYPEHQLFEVDVFSDVCFGPKNLGDSRRRRSRSARKRRLTWWDSMRAFISSHPSTSPADRSVEWLSRVFSQ